MKLSIVIPCYNEKNTIQNILEVVRKVPIEDKEIIVVDSSKSKEDTANDKLKIENIFRIFVCTVQCHLKK